jgi:hypothetical protein
MNRSNKIRAFNAEVDLSLYLTGSVIGQKKTSALRAFFIGCIEVK